MVKAIAGYQKVWMSASFAKFGSLYYAEDLPGHNSHDFLYVNEDGAEVRDSRFAVGPSTGREVIDDGRAAVTFDRGPCKIVVIYES